MALILNRVNWSEFQTKLKKEYPQLTDSDLQHKEGNEERMFLMIEYKLWKTKKEMMEIIAGMGFYRSEI